MGRLKGNRMIIAFFKLYRGTSDYDIFSFLHFLCFQSLD